jgi:DNA-binding NarL/FixJ family response regulator
VTRILIADDHAIVRLGVRALLSGQPGWQICGEASNGREAVAKAIELRPDIVLLDVGMPEMNGLEAARQIRRAVPTAQVLVLTVHEAEQLARDFAEAGARGYLLKSDAGRMLIEAIATLINHGTFFHGHAEAALALPRDPLMTDRRLTPREREVLQLLAEGRSNKEVGVALNISTKTAETHRARLMSKLGVHSLADVVRYAIRNHIVDV